MSAQVRVETHTPTARCRLGALRRVASVCLLLGWSAFWLVATLQPCCKLSVAVPHPVSAEAASQSASLDNRGNAGHHTPDSSDICRDITIVAGVALATAVHSFAGEQPAYAYPAGVIEERYAVRRAIHAIATNYPPLPPARALPFYLRTSRILI